MKKEKVDYSETKNVITVNDIDPELLKSAKRVERTKNGTALTVVLAVICICITGFCSSYQCIQDQYICKDRYICAADQ